MIGTITKPWDKKIWSIKDFGEKKEWKPLDRNLEEEEEDCAALGKEILGRREERI
jgi:hypothetical protein